MRLLFDARSVRTPSGRYILEGLTTGWLADSRVSAVFAAVRRDFDLALLPASVSHVTLGGGSWAAHLLTGLPKAADECGADVIFCPNGMAPRDRRSVLYYQDMFHFRLEGGAPSPAQEWLKNRARASWRLISIDGCRLAVSVSREISREVDQRVRIPSVVIPNGVDVGSAWWSGERNEVFVLGGIGPRKDEQTAVHAWARVPAARRGGATLRLGGVEPAWRRERLRALSARLGVASEVCIAGTLPRAEFLDAIVGARLVVSCSRQEAFSLPVAESVAMGAPLICTSIPSHLELLQSAGVGSTFAPRDVAALAEGLTAALDGSLPPRLQSRPVGWSWADRAREHVDAYERYA